MQSSGMQWFAAMGAWGILLLLLTAALVLANVICAAVRVTRRAAAVFVAASFLPLLVGFLGMLHGLSVSAQVIATLRTPTPQDLAVGNYESEICLMAGLAGTLLCYAVALVSLVRSREPEPRFEQAAAA